MDMTTREPNAPQNTTMRGWRMARMAAIRKVLSPISEAMIMKKEFMSAWTGLSSTSLLGVDMNEIEL
jgi:hypothetical protein